MKTALLIIDMQNGCYESTEEKKIFLDAAEYINEVSEMYRTKGLPVIVIQDLEVGEGEGSEAFDVHASINVESSDICVQKKFSNSFWETNLEAILKEHGVDFLVISGFAAEYCITFTYGGAEERGYNVALLQHGIAGMEKQAIRDTQRIRPVIAYSALGYFLENM